MEQISRLLPGLSGVHGSAVVIGGVTLAGVVLLQRIDRRIPAFVLAFILGGLVAQLPLWPEDEIAFFAPLDSVIPALTTSSFDLDLWGQLLPGAAPIAFVGLLEAISIGKSFAARRGERYDSNQELIGRGLSNVVGSFTQCHFGSGSLTRMSKASPPQPNFQTRYQTLERRPPGRRLRFEHPWSTVEARGAEVLHTAS